MAPTWTALHHHFASPSLSPPFCGDEDATPACSFPRAAVRVVRVEPRRPLKVSSPSGPSLLEPMGKSDALYTPQTFEGASSRYNALTGAISAGKDVEAGFGGGGKAPWVDERRRVFPYCSGVATSFYADRRIS